MQVSYNSPAAMWHRMAETTKLLFKSARVNIEFTRDGWKQLLQQNTSPVSAFIQSINIKADLALYIVAHEDKGIFMDTECQEICYQSGLFLIIRKSRMAKHWQNKELLWSELLEKLSTTTRTRETVAEYAAMNKEDKNRCKDVGGFVAGYLKGGKRNNTSVVNRCAVCLDADYADPGLLDDLDMTFINAYALYSTHSHTSEQMRLRIIIPLARTVTPDEYAAVARRIANDLTLPRFDPTTFEPARLMYWPSTPEDGDYVFKYEDAPFLDPDVVLASYADWKDTSLWPTTQPVEERVHSAATKAEDPLTKGGIVGAFCRAHSMTDVLETILSSFYTPTVMDGRYTYVNGTSVGGLVVYDDKFAFSHHATDAASAWVCNGYATIGKKACASRRVPEKVLIPIIAELLGVEEEAMPAAVSRISTMTIYPDGRLEATIDGKLQTAAWGNVSRRDSWDETRRKRASEQMKETWKRRKAE